MPVINNQQPNAMQNPVAPQGRKQKGTGFTNIRNLLQANVGAGGVMGAGLASGLGQKAGQLRQDVQTAGQQFGQQYQQQKEKTLGQGGSVAGVGEYLTGKQDVSGLTEEEAKNLGTGLAEAQYTGPTQLANQQTLLGRAGNIQALSTLAGMGGIGQGRLLQGTATRRGGYTRGQGLLDQYLVGQDVGAQEAIRAAAAQGAGAAEQTQTGVDVAQQQAEGLKASIEAEKQSVKQNVLKALASTQEEATQSAKQYLAQAERIKKALAAAAGGDGIPLSELNSEDLAALQNLQAYGIDPATITTADDLSNMLKGISSAGTVQFSGQQRYKTDAEQRAAKNLALISGQEDVAKKISSTEFDPEVFQGGNEAVRAQVAGSKANTERIEQELGWSGPEQAKQKADYFNRGLDAFYNRNRGDEGLVNPGTDIGDKLGMNPSEGQFEDLLKNPSGIFLKRAAELLGKNTLWDIYRYGDRGNFLGGTTPYRRNFTMDRIREAYEKKLAKVNELNTRYQNRTSLQDYINKKFNIGLPQQGS